MHAGEQPAVGVLLAVKFGRCAAGLDDGLEWRVAQVVRQPPGEQLIPDDTQRVHGQLAAFGPQRQLPEKYQYAQAQDDICNYRNAGCGIIVFEWNHRDSASGTDRSS